MHANQLIAVIKTPIHVIGDVGVECSHFSIFEESNTGSVTYLTANKFEHLKSLPKSLNMSLLILDRKLSNRIDQLLNIESACVVIVDDARKVFATLLDELGLDSPMLANERRTEISPTAFVHPQATVEQGVVIKEGSYISAGAVIKQNTFIGKSVRVGENSVIGKDGFGFITLEDGRQYRFRHIGGVEVGDDVEIGALSVIDRGTLSSTRIGAGVKIDNLVHIAHNVMIGENTLVIASATVCGSVTIGKNCRIAPGAVIREGLSVGDHAIVGLGSVVLKNVASRTIVVGNPAKYLRDI
jgi:UDP-3-O-[3-hydroxymyristoyl] glucosamine N-acyltransferase